MGYVDKYKAYLNEVPADINRCKLLNKYPVFGYTSNLDVLLKWDVNAFNRFLEEFPSVDLMVDAGDRIESVLDFARVFGHYAVTGQGGGGYILDGAVCERLEEIFESDYGLGGTCAQGTMAIAAVGVPLVVHITDRSKEVCAYMENERIRFVSEAGLISASEAASEEPPLRHMILQFNKGDVIRAGGCEYRIPASNRLILDFDEIHKIVPIDEVFLDYCEEHAGSITSYNVSGFNAIIDTDIAQERIARLCRHFGNMKKRNSDCIIYLEGAHYFNPEVKDFVFTESAPYVDIFGMNEEELVEITIRLGKKADISDPDSIIHSLNLLIDTFHMNGIVMHTKDYSLYYGKDPGAVNIEKGLTLGNLLSGTRARTGRYGTFDDCLETLKLDISPVGLQFAGHLAKMQLQHYACIVPSRYMESPVCTVGLGDTFVAGVQICFM